MVLELIYSIIRMCYKIFIKWWRSPSPAAVAPQQVAGQVVNERSKDEA